MAGPPDDARREPLSVLLVEDSETDAFLVQRWLRQTDLALAAVRRAATLAEAADAAADAAPDVALVDMHLPDADGLDVVRRFHARAPRTAIVVLTGTDDRDLALRTLSAGAQDYLLKDEMSPRLLEKTIRFAHERQRHQGVRRERLATKRLVRGLLNELARLGTATVPLRREIGRELGRAAEGRDVEELLGSFNEMGLGEITLERVEGDRYVFAGRDNLEVVPGNGTTTCHIGVGFLEAVVARVTRRETLGTEMSCQSQGRERCLAVVQARGAA